MYSMQNSLLSSTWDLLACEADNTRNLEELIHFNYQLQKEGKLTNLNEQFLERKLDELENIPNSRQEIYWLTFARLTELALFCAGNYADNEYFMGVGDLLFNPRLIKVHIRGHAKPVVKKRHGALSEQFSHLATSQKDVVPWMIQNTLLETVKEPLLAQMYQTIESSGFFAHRYLHSIKSRMIKVADTSALLAVRSVWHEQNPQEYPRTMSESEREIVMERLCRFDKALFQELGEDILRLIADNSYKTRYLIDETSSNLALSAKKNPW